MGILTLLRNAFGGRSRKAAATEAEGAVPSQEATEPKLPSPATEPTPASTATTPTSAEATVPEPRSATLSTESEHELVSAAFDKVAVPKQSPGEGEAAATETAGAETPVAETPVAEESAAEEPVVAETPVAEEATAEREVPVEAPVAEEPVVEEAKAEPEAAVAEPVTEEAPAEEPVAERDVPAEATVAEEAVLGETSAEPKTAVAAEPVTEAAPAEEPVAEPEASVVEPVAEEAPAEEPVAEAAVTDEPAEETAVEPPAAEEAAPAEPETPAEEPVAEEKGAEDTAVEQPVADEPAPVAVEEEKSPEEAAEPEPAAEAPEPLAAEEAEPTPEPEPEPVAETTVEPEPEPTAEVSPEPAPEPLAAAIAADDETGTGGAGGNEKAVPPTLRTAYDAAATSLSTHDLNTTTAKTYLVLDRSASMRAYYKDGSAQALGEQTLALAAHLDPTATVHVVFFSTELDGTGELTLTDHENKIDDLHAGLGRMGRTSYHAAVEEVLAHHTKENPDTPALVVFQTDGAPDAKTPATQALTAAAKTHPTVFFSFVAFGDPENKAFDYLRKLKLPNTSHFLAGETPKELTDTEIYEGILANWRP